MYALISVIIPVYNHAADLPNSFASLAKQTYRPLEACIVDDGSTDNFVSRIDVLKKIAEANKITLKIIRQKNKGASAARNKGWTNSKGEYIIFWDADTIARPTMIEKMYRALLGDQQAAFAYCQYRFGWKIMKSQSFSAEDLKKYNYIDTTSLIRREFFPGFDESLKRFQDWDLWLTICEKGSRGIFVKEVLYKKITGARKGYSSWLPSFAYHLPWKNKKVVAYENAKKIIFSKHKITD